MWIGDTLDAANANCFSEEVDPGFRRDVLDGLMAFRKSMPSKYFYDETGSKLFDQICELPEYYPTRTETQIMRAHASEMASCLFGDEEFGDDLCLIELGSGSSTKTPLLLSQFEPLLTYVPVDISREHLLASADTIAHQFPQFDVQPVVADFTSRFDLPDAASQHDRLCIYFPGSTIGNFAREDAVRLLHRMRLLCTEFKPDSGKEVRAGLLIGFDLHKSTPVLESAYDDAAGVTAKFNLNLLARINRELGADFDLRQFFHRAFYDESEKRIEMQLVSRVQQCVHIAGRTIEFDAGESIRTEYSHKYTVSGFRDLAAEAGWELQRTWKDIESKFAVGYFVANEGCQQTDEG